MADRQTDTHRTDISKANLSPRLHEPCTLQKKDFFVKNVWYGIDQEFKEFERTLGSPAIGQIALLGSWNFTSVTNKFASKCATIWPKCAQKCATEEFGQNVLKNAPQKIYLTPLSIFIAFLCINFFRCQIFLKKKIQFIRKQFLNFVSST